MAFEAKGLDGAQAIVTTLQAMAATKAGADWVVDPRRPDGSGSQPSNAELLEFLANPKHGPKRDIRINDSDGDELNKIIADELVKQLNRVGQVVAPSGGSAMVVQADKQARAGIVGGLRKAAKRAAAIMYERIKNMRTNTGGALQPPTNEASAARRKKLHGVNESVALIATRQLVEALQKGNIKVRFDSSGLSSALKIIRG